MPCYLALKQQARLRLALVRHAQRRRGTTQSTVGEYLDAITGEHATGLARTREVGTVRLLVQRRVKHANRQLLLAGKSLILRPSAFD